jgi:hypothetical protein
LPVNERAQTEPERKERASTFHLARTANQNRQSLPSGFEFVRQVARVCKAQLR